MAMKLISATRPRLTGDTDEASETNAGSLRYRVDGSKSLVEVVMQTGAAAWAWVEVARMEW